MIGFSKRKFLLTALLFSFVLAGCAAGYADELDVTDYLITEGENKAPSVQLEAESPESQLFAMHGLTWAYNYGEQPVNGRTAPVSGKTSQLRDCGFFFEFNLDGVPDGKHALAMISNRSVYITREDIGEGNFNALVKRLETIRDEHPETDVGGGYVMPGIGDQEYLKLLGEYGLEFVWTYADGTERVVSGGVSFGLGLSEAEQGKMHLSYAVLAVDGNQVNGSVLSDYTVEIFGIEGPVLYDGTHDEKISGTVWLRKSGRASVGSSGGCDSGMTGLIPLAASFLMFAAHEIKSCQVL